MHTPLTYGQCLRKIMQSNHLSVNTLARKMGYHSPTQLSRILNDEVSPTLITKFHHQFMLIFDWLISPAEIKSLSTSLQFSCLGEEQFLTRRAMYHMLFEPTYTRADKVQLTLYPSGGERNGLDFLFSQAERYEEIDLLVLGSAFDSLLPVFADLVARCNKKNSIRLRHAFILEEKPAKIVSRIGTLVPYLNIPAYTGVYCTAHAEDACRFLQQNQIAVARCKSADGSVKTALFTPPQGDRLCLLGQAGDALYTFYEQQFNLYKDQLRPIKSVYPHPKTAQSLLTLCERDLFLEKNRTCCFVRLDLCFHALPAPIILNAVDHGARMNMELSDPVLQEMIRVHQARHQNLFEKQKPTALLLSRTSMLEFIKTGHMSDHLYAMRNFTLQERKDVLIHLLSCARKNPELHIHFFRDEAFEPGSAFSAYEDMGMQVSDNHTAYDLGGDHSELFIGLPEFAHVFISYCFDTLIPEYCLDREESFTFIESLIATLDEAILKDEH